jgi:phosphopantetheinyl transferase
MTLDLPIDGEVHVWLVPCSATEPARKRTAARTALEAIVSGYAPHASAVFRAGRRPEVVGAPLHVSLARADRLALVAVATGREVGVDVEPTAPAPPPAVVAHLLTEREARGVEQQPSGGRDAAFARAWVRKEAVLKAAGVGLAVEPRLVEVGVEPGAQRVVSVPGRGHMTVSDLAFEGHVAAVAASGTAAVRVRLFELEPTVSGRLGRQPERQLA